MPADDIMTILVRLLTPDGLERQPRQRQRGCTYDHHLDDAVRIIAEMLDYIRAERLQPSLVPQGRRSALPTTWCGMAS